MKTIKALPLILFSSLLLSCNQGVQLQPKTYEYFVLDQMQNSVEIEYYRGQEKLYGLRETVMDRSEPYRATRAGQLYKSALSIDSAVSVFLKEIRTIKKEMIRDESELKRMFDQVRKHPNLPFVFQLDKIRITPVSHSKEKIQKVQEKFIAVRSCISSEMANYESGNSSIGRYFFNDPYLDEFESPKKTVHLIEKAFKISNVAQDDKEAIKKIYGSMTKMIFQMPINVSNSVELFSLLTATENGVLTSRADALALIRSRISGCGYAIDKILPFVDCPAIAHAGDTVTASGMMAAYDSDKPPYVIANGEMFEKTNRGIAYRNFVVPDKNKFIISGTITMRNKSGVPKTMPFEKTIHVLPKEE